MPIIYTYIYIYIYRERERERERYNGIPSYEAVHVEILPFYMEIFY